MGRASQRRNHYNLRWPEAEVLKKQINPAGQIQVCETRRLQLRWPGKTEMKRRWCMKRVSGPKCRKPTGRRQAPRLSKDGLAAVFGFWSSPTLKKPVDKEGPPSEKHVSTLGQEIRAFRQVLWHKRSNARTAHGHPKPVARQPHGEAGLGVRRCNSIPACVCGLMRISYQASRG